MFLPGREPQPLDVAIATAAAWPDSGVGALPPPDLMRELPTERRP
jgi:hypothetical protein